MTTDAKKAEDVVAAPIPTGQQAAATPNVSRTEKPSIDFEHVAKTQTGRVKTLQAELDQLKAAQVEQKRKELEEQNKYQELYEADKEERNSLKKTIASKDETIAEATARLEKLEASQKKREEQAIQSLLSDIPESERAEHVEYLDGLSYEKQEMYLQRISKTYKKTTKAPIIQGSVSTETGGDSLKDKLRNRIKEKKKKY